MNNWNLTIIILSAVVGIVMLRKEWLRINRHWRYGRSIASLIAVAGLCGLGLQWKSQEQKKETASNKNPGDSSHAERNGFLDIHWTPVLKSGQPLQVQGEYKNASNSVVTIYLDGFNTLLDSVLIPSGKSRLFQLTTIPKQTGKAVFQLVLNENKKIFESEPVPVVIQPADSLNLLILSSYPDFENKFLGQWLTSNRIRVVQRTRISKDRFEKNFMNRPAFEFNQISEEFLKPFDLLICDDAALSTLSAAEQNAVRHQISELGMGLILRTDSIRNRETYYASPFPLYRIAVKTNGQRRLFTTDSSRAMIYPADRDLMGIRFQKGTEPLVRDQEDQILVSSKLEGRGKMVFSTINNTFQWSLDGNLADYGAYWTCLIQQASRQRTASLHLYIAEKFPFVNSPVHIKIENEGTRPVEPAVGKDSFYLRQNKNIPMEQTGIYWPKEAGWQPAIHASGQYLEWYVYESGDWAGFSPEKQLKLPEIQEPEQKGKDLYFILFLMSGWVFLWIERKLSLI